MMNKIKIILEMIKFEHTIFALPFAFTGALLAAHGLPSWRTLLWITVAMVGARSAAMGFNRWADRAFDAENPRTKVRALPLGLVTPGQVVLFTAVSSLVLVAAAYMLNPLSFYLSPVALGDRFLLFLHQAVHVPVPCLPRACHLSCSDRRLDSCYRDGSRRPRWCWERPSCSGSWGSMSCTRLQDMDFDRSAGLHSIPQRFGIRRSLWISRASHAVTMVALFGLAFLLPLGRFYLAASALRLLLIVYEHALVRENDLSKLNIAFFNMNGYISVTIFLFTLLDVVL